jgi:hypothetical protein
MVLSNLNPTSSECFQICGHVKRPPPEPPPMEKMKLLSSYVCICVFLFTDLPTDLYLCFKFAVIVFAFVFCHPPRPPWLYWIYFKGALMVFDDMSQQEFVLLVKKSLTGPFGIVNTNSCNYFLFQFSFNRVFNFDIFEITYSRNEPAAVVNLIRNWIGKKTVDSLLFSVIDRGRKILQLWKFDCRSWINGTHLDCSHFFTPNAHSLSGFNFSCFLSTCWRCFKDFSLNQLVILMEIVFN